MSRRRPRIPSVARFVTPRIPTRTPPPPCCATYSPLEAEGTPLVFDPPDREWIGAAARLVARVHAGASRRCVRRCAAHGSTWRAFRASALPARRGKPGERRRACSTRQTRLRSAHSSPARSPSWRSRGLSLVPLRRCPRRQPTHFDDLIATDSEARRRAAEAVASGTPMSWAPGLRGFRRAGRPSRSGALCRRQGRRHEGRALLPVLPAQALSPSRGVRPSMGSARSRSEAS